MLQQILIQIDTVHAGSYKRVIAHAFWLPNVGKMPNSRLTGDVTIIINISILL